MTETLADLPETRFIGLMSELFQLREAEEMDFDLVESLVYLLGPHVERPYREQGSVVITGALNRSRQTAAVFWRGNAEHGADLAASQNGRTSRRPLLHQQPRPPVVPRRRTLRRHRNRVRGRDGVTSGVGGFAQWIGLNQHFHGQIQAARQTADHRHGQRTSTIQNVGHSPARPDVRLQILAR